MRTKIQLNLFRPMCSRRVIRPESESDPWNGASLDVIWYHGNPYGSLGAYVPGLVICGLVIVVMVRPMLLADSFVNSLRGAAFTIRSPYPLVVTKVLDRPRNTWYEWWATLLLYQQIRPSNLRINQRHIWLPKLVIGVIKTLSVWPSGISSVQKLLPWYETIRPRVSTSMCRLMWRAAAPRTLTMDELLDELSLVVECFSDADSLSILVEGNGNGVLRVCASLMRFFLKDSVPISEDINQPLKGISHRILFCSFGLPLKRHMDDY